MTRIPGNGTPNIGADFDMLSTSSSTSDRANPSPTPDSHISSNLIERIKSAITGCFMALSFSPAVGRLRYCAFRIYNFFSDLKLRIFNLIGISHPASSLITSTSYINSTKAHRTLLDLTYTLIRLLPKRCERNYFEIRLKKLNLHLPTDNKPNESTNIQIQLNLLFKELQKIKKDGIAERLNGIARAPTVEKWEQMINHFNEALTAIIQKLELITLENLSQQQLIELQKQICTILARLIGDDENNTGSCPGILEIFHQRKTHTVRHT